MSNVTITVNGKKLSAPAGALLIDVCRQAGIEIPAFCYYPGLSLQAACRMCLVRQEKVPRLQTACTTQIAEGQVFTTDSEEISQARKATLELLLANHPLDCPVCDAGGECELQDMTFKYGAGESLFAEAKRHREEQKWSPAVYYDRPRCILCYRCIRVCGEGMDVHALGIQFRGASAVIAPNNGNHLDCEQCGMCIDICPVGALTSGSYRYKTRPWEMKHVSTVCTHCADGCRVTLGVRQTATGATIYRADNRDKSGMNGDFLCAKGRFGFDFVDHEERLTQPLVRNSEGKLEPATWEQALRTAASRLKEVRAARGGSAIGVLGSSRITNEENYLLQKFARTVLQTNNIDHERRADYVPFVSALAESREKAASLRETATAPAILLIGGNPTEENPLLAWNLRTNVRLNKARLYVVNNRAIKLERQARKTLRTEDSYTTLPELLSDTGNVFAQAIAEEPSLLMILSHEVSGEAFQAMLRWGLKRGNVRFALNATQANSRGASDMGVLPNFLPGYRPVSDPKDFSEYDGLPRLEGRSQAEMLALASANELGALLAVGADPVTQHKLDSGAFKDTFLVVQDIFLTPTAALADVVFPSASLYEKTGTVTNSFGDVQRVNKAADRPGVKSDFEILVRLAGAMGVDMKSLVPFGKSSLQADMGQSRGVNSGEADRHAVWLEAHGLEAKLSPLDPMAAFDEIRRLVRGYDLDTQQLTLGDAVHAEPGFVPLADLMQPVATEPEMVQPAHEGIFVSVGLDRYSKALQELQQHQTKTADAVAAD